jgi:hypothetical protein
MSVKLNYNTKELLSNEEAQKEELEFMLEEAQQQFNADRLAIKKQLAKAQRDLAEAQTAFPYSASKEVELTMEVAALEKAIEILAKIGDKNGWN